MTGNVGKSTGTRNERKNMHASRAYEVKKSTYQAYQMYQT